MSDIIIKNKIKTNIKTKQSSKCFRTNVLHFRSNETLALSSPRINHKLVGTKAHQ